MILIPQRKAVVFKLRDPSKITTIIPTAKTFEYNGATMVAVPHRVEEAKVLRNMGYDVPSPAGYYYDWPGQFKPFFAQKETVNFLTMHSRAFCLNDMGTGKTLSTLWSYDYLRSRGLRKRMLVVTPLSTLERTWGDTIFNHFSHLEFSVLHGSRERRINLLNQKVDIYLVNHHGIKIIEDELKTRDDIDLVVVDEVSQAARNASTDMWKALNTVCNKQVPRDVWGLTGTPTPNAPTDAWAQCRLVTPSTVPPYFNRFKDAVMRQAGPFTWIPRPGSTDTVKEAMQPAIRFAMDDCVDLPPCIYESREVDLTAEQKKAYKEMLNTLKTEVEGGEVLAVNEAVKMSKLVQIACGVAYSSSGDEVTVNATPRLEATREIIEEAGTKVLVYVPFVSSISAVADYLVKHGVTVEVVHGGVSRTERDRIFYEFQNMPDPRVIVAQPGCLSHGLTLTAASTIIWYAPITSNDTYTQANARIVRPGQKHTQLIVEIEGTPVERKIYARLKDKQSLQGMLLQLIEDAK